MIRGLDCILNVTESPWRVLRLGIIFSHLRFLRSLMTVWRMGYKGTRMREEKTQERAVAVVHPCSLPHAAETKDTNSEDDEESV